MILTNGLTLAIEEMNDSLIEEIKPLALRHWIAVGRKDVTFSPQYENYKALDKAGMSVCLTVREIGTLVGYAIFLIRRHPYYSETFYATNDVIFLDKQARKGLNGYNFIKMCEKKMELIGANVIEWGTTLERNFGVLLERIGYQATRMIYERRIS